MIFTKLRYQNFLSTGNQFTEIHLNKSKSTLIIGKNGSGKTSSICDPLFFVLFNRPYRKINKPQLVNSITKKNLLVEVEFEIGSRSYLIRRGMKPTVFEIYIDGVLLEQDAALGDYQEYLEKNILKMGYKTFGQIVILGSTNYVPFMQLTAADRRAVIEDLLDLNLFTLMNSVLKRKIDKNKEDLKEVEGSLALIENSIEHIQRNIQALNQNNQELIEGRKKKIKEIELQIQSKKSEAHELNFKIDELLKESEDHAKLNSRKDKLIEFKSKMSQKIKGFETEISFMRENDNCPTCKQIIQEDFKNSTIEENNLKVDEIRNGLTKLTEEYNILQDRMVVNQKIMDQISDLRSEVRDCEYIIDSQTKSLKSVIAEMESIQGSNKFVEGSEEDLKDLEKQKTQEVDKKYELLEDKNVLIASQVLLKDTGIKTKIINQYVPKINEIVNQYLSTLNFFVSFELDDKFNETIRSRHRDDFSYESFSEGEKFRIDISLMFTWREIARLKSAISTNLLVMDEIFDGSTDQDGVDSLMEILNTLDSKTNVFIISHSEKMIDKLHSVIRFEKHKNFSRIARD